ncbi:hypothetical protein D781_3010 [Serratia sp. FGI94]|uniref:hypothetical protein n=1 Tax=Serratia sp. FGI94 TaxID=671990 RepID=UPI0002A7307D|nr:hypothetical protein [Serratia sp. FGI94]AGB83247.1 hypothetical protein D781_3010 [Serratia sp. FGI94]
MFIEQNKEKTKKYDKKIRPIIEELLDYGFGVTALSNALNQKSIPSVNRPALVPHTF